MSQCERSAFVITHVSEQSLIPENDPTGEVRRLYESIDAQIPIQRAMGRLIVSLDWFGSTYQPILDRKPDLIVPRTHGMSYQFLHTKALLMERGVTDASVVGVSYYACVRRVDFVLRGTKRTIDECTRYARTFNPHAPMLHAENLFIPLRTEILSEYTDKHLQN